MELCESEAWCIADRVLDRWHSALEAQDAEGFLSILDVPMVFETFEGTKVNSSRDEHLDFLRCYQRFVISAGISHSLRSLIAATYLDANTVRFCHETRNFRPGNLLADPSVAISVLARRPSGWLVTHVTIATTSKMQDAFVEIVLKGEPPRARDPFPFLEPAALAEAMWD